MYHKDNKCTWIFNPPHSSHMDGVWERMICIAYIYFKCSSSQFESIASYKWEPSHSDGGGSCHYELKTVVPVSSHPESPHQCCWHRMGILTLTTFPTRWRKEYVTMLQKERKRNQVKPNLQVEVVLLKDSQVKRTKRTFSSQGSKV